MLDVKTWVRVLQTRYFILFFIDFVKVTDFILECCMNINILDNY